MSNITHPTNPTNINVTNNCPIQWPNTEMCSGHGICVNSICVCDGPWYSQTDMFAANDCGLHETIVTTLLISVSIIACIMLMMCIHKLISLIYTIYNNQLHQQIQIQDEDIYENPLVDVDEEKIDPIPTSPQHQHTSMSLQVPQIRSNPHNITHQISPSQSHSRSPSPSLTSHETEMTSSSHALTVPISSLLVIPPSSHPSSTPPTSPSRSQTSINRVNIKRSAMEPIQHTISLRVTPSQWLRTLISTSDFQNLFIAILGAIFTLSTNVLRITTSRRIHYDPLLTFLYATCNASLFGTWLVWVRSWNRSSTAAAAHYHHQSVRHHYTNTQLSRASQQSSLFGITILLIGTNFLLQNLPVLIFDSTDTSPLSSSCHYRRLINSASILLSLLCGLSILLFVAIHAAELIHLLIVDKRTVRQQDPEFQIQRSRFIHRLRFVMYISILAAFTTLTQCVGTVLVTSFQAKSMYAWPLSSFFGSFCYLPMITLIGKQVALPSRIITVVNTRRTTMIGRNESMNEETNGT